MIDDPEMDRISDMEYERDLAREDARYLYLLRQALHKARQKMFLYEVGDPARVKWACLVHQLNRELEEME